MPVKRWTAQQWRDIFSFVGTGYGGKTINDASGAYANVGTVFRCVTVIRDAGTLPVRLESADGEPVSNTKFNEWMREPFNSMTWEFWLGLVLSHITLSGGCRLVAIDPEQNPNWLMPYSLNTCRIAPGQTFPPQAYRIGAITYPREQVVDVIPPDPTSLHDAIAPAEASLLSAKAAFQTDRHSSETLEHGAVVAGVLMLKQAMTSDRFKEFTDKFMAQVRSTKNGGLVFMDGAEAELHQVGMSLADLALPELGNMSRAEIAKAMGVPPALLGDSEARYANFKEQRVTFLEDVLRPRWRLIEGALTQRVVPMLGLKTGLKAKLVESDSYIARLLWQDAASALSMTAGRVVTVNEARKRLGLPEIGPEGDMLERPFTAVTYNASAKLPSRTGNVDAARAALDFIKGRPTRDINHRPDAMRATYWRVFDRLAARFDSAKDGTYTSKFNKLFRATKAALADAAKANWEKSGTIPYEREQFDTAAMRARMTVLPAVWREAMDNAQSQIADAAGKAFKPSEVRTLAEDIIAKLRLRAEHWTEISGDQTFLAIDELQALAASEGWTLQQVLDALESEAMLSSARAERIARTEILAVLNESTLDTYAASGEVGGKEWLAIQDDRTRDGHAMVDGQTVTLGSPFMVDNEPLDYPGDPAGSPGNIINCRCTVLPVLVPEEG